MDKMQIISNYVRQSYDIFNTYGRSAGSLENICIGFYQILKGYDDGYINNAFDYWLANHSAMPTPAEIKSKCDDYARWDKECEKISSEKRARPALHAPTKKTVSWYLIPAETFNQNINNYLSELKSHKQFLIQSNGLDHAKSYFNQYLRDYLKYNISYESL